MFKDGGHDEEDANFQQSKEELAEQLGLSFLVYSNLTRDEMLQSLHEAILSEPANYEAIFSEPENYEPKNATDFETAKNATETPFEKTELEPGIDQMDPFEAHGCPLGFVGGMVILTLIDRKIVVNKGMRKTNFYQNSRK